MTNGELMKKRLLVAAFSFTLFLSLQRMVFGFLPRQQYCLCFWPWPALYGNDILHYRKVYIKLEYS